MLYNFKDTLEVSKIKDLTFTTLIKSNLTDIKSISEYWKNYKDSSKSKELVIYFLLSLMPIVSVHYALAFSIISSRYEKSHEYLAMLVFLLIYLTPMMMFLNYHFYTIFGVFFTTLLISKACFRKKILNKY